MGKINREFLRETLLEIEPNLQEEDKSYPTALILIAALACGTDVKQLADLTGVRQEFVSNIQQRMIVAELWTEVAACCDHWFLPNAFCLNFFWFDVLVAEGLAVRRWI